MAKEKGQLAQALESYGRWIEAKWKILTGFAACVIFILIALLSGDIKFGDRLQAASMIALVFITAYYAVRTQELVKEQRRNAEEEMKRRDAEFGEKRIHNFLGPFGTMLRRFQDSLDFLALSDSELESRDFPAFINSMRKEVNDIESFFSANMYMANDNYNGKILPLMEVFRLSCWTIESWDQDRRAEWLNERTRDLETLIGQLEVETHHIARQIQAAYGDYAQRQIL